MELTRIEIGTLRAHPDNYNQHLNEQLDALGESLEKFEQFKNIVVSNGVILAGHGLVEAAKRKGWTHIEAVVMDGLTEDEQRALLIADNSLPAMALPDTTKLYELLASLPNIDDIPGVTPGWLESIDTSMPGEEEEDGDHDDTYTKKIKAPVYEPKNEKPGITELFDMTKSLELMEEIQQADIPEAEKAFLIEAAKRHTVFDYQKIADYYSNSPKPVQALMEKSALIIIDFEQAIEQGYVKLSEEIAAQYLEEYPDE